MPRKSHRALWTKHLAGGAVLKAQKVPDTLVRERYTGIVLGIDPSLRGTGLAVVSFGQDGYLRLLESLTVKLNRDLSLCGCLGEISRNVRDLLNKYAVKHVASELTIYVQNSKTALTLGTARGAAFTAVAVEGLEVFEYPPRRIKQAVTGSGRASKEQVAGQVRSLLGGAELLPLDEADAAGVAICHAWTYGGNHTDH